MANSYAAFTLILHGFEVFGCLQILACATKNAFNTACSGCRCTLAHIYQSIRHVQFDIYHETRYYEIQFVLFLRQVHKYCVPGTFHIGSAMAPFRQHFKT